MHLLRRRHLSANNDVEEGDKNLSIDEMSPDQFFMVMWSGGFLYIHSIYTLFGWRSGSRILSLPLGMGGYNQ